MSSKPEKMTIRDIAAQCGVSRGTVDRVLNRRGRVSPDTRQKVLSALDAAGYTKNIAGLALNLRRSNPLIAVVLCGVGNPFFDQVLQGIRRGEASLKDWGIRVEIVNLAGYHPEAQRAAIAALPREISALVLQPVTHPLIEDEVNRLADQGIPTITVNTDLPSSRRAGYVGSDYTQGGRVAGGMMRLMAGDEGRILIVGGARRIAGHHQRLSGFLSGCGKDMQVLDTGYGEDDPQLVYRETLGLMKDHPDAQGLFVAAAGADGACRAIREMGRGDALRVVAFDLVPPHVEMMRQGLIHALISQQPEQQGYEAMRTAWETMLTNAPAAIMHTMAHSIHIRQNIEDHLPGTTPAPEKP